MTVLSAEYLDLRRILIPGDRIETDNLALYPEASNHARAAERRRETLTVTGVFRYCVLARDARGIERTVNWFNIRGSYKKMAREAR